MFVFHSCQANLPSVILKYSVWYTRVHWKRLRLSLEENIIIKYIIKCVIKRDDTDNEQAVCVRQTKRHFDKQSVIDWLFV